MSRICTKPDRDVPKLMCGYPMPCPHHTVVIHASELENGVLNMAWVRGRVSIGTYVRAITKQVAPGSEEVTTVLRVSAQPWFSNKQNGIGDKNDDTSDFERDLALDASLAEIRAALEEVQIEAMEWLLAKRSPESP